MEGAAHADDVVVGVRGEDQCRFGKGHTVRDADFFVSWFATRPASDAVRSE